MVVAQTTFIAAAKRAGVKHVVKLSGIIPDPDSPFRFARMHAAIERILAESGMAFTVLRAGEFMHSYFRAITGIVSRGLLLLPMENARIASVDVGDVAQAAAVVLTDIGHEGKTYRLTGPESLTMVEVAQRLTAATGNFVRYINVPPEDARRANLAAGLSPFLADALVELFAERRKSKEAMVWPDLQALLGVKPTTFEQFAARHAAVFRGEVPPPA
jgi:uncharacterized protein YbjT (DUF2867 family)